jgi:hypothetical protein
MGRVISIIYKMTHLPTGRFYIGSLKDSSRFSTYVTSSKSVSKMMTENPAEWVKEIVEEFTNISFYDVVIKEQHLIEHYVKTIGWDKIWNKFYHVGVAECYSPETIAKRSESQLRPETKLKKSIATSKRMESPEMREHLAQKTRNQMSDPKYRAIIARANSRRVHSDETRRRLSESHKDILHTEEAKKKIGKAHLGRKKMLDLEGNDKRVKAEDISMRLLEGWKLVRL